MKSNLTKTNKTKNKNKENKINTAVNVIRMFDKTLDFSPSVVELKKGSSRMPSSSPVFGDRIAKNELLYSSDPIFARAFSTL